MVLNFSWGQKVSKRTVDLGEQEGHTNVEHVASAAGIKTKRSTAAWARLRVRLADKFVEACFMGDVRAAQLEDALAAEGMFEGLFTDNTFTTGESALSARMRAINVEHTSHAGMLMSGSQRSGIGGAGAFLSSSGWSSSGGPVTDAVGEVVRVRRAAGRVFRSSESVREGRRG